MGDLHNVDGRQALVGNLNEMAGVSPFWRGYAVSRTVSEIPRSGKPCAPWRSMLAVAFCLLFLSTQVAAQAVTFNLKDADITAVIGTVSEITGRNFIVDPRVKGKVTIISSRPMEKEEIYQVFLSVLEVYGFAAVPEGKAIKIIPAANAKQSATRVATNARPGSGDEFVTRVIELENVSAAQLVPILRPLVPQEGHLVAHPDSNLLIISDRASNIERMIKIIQRLDQPTTGDIEIVTLKHASAVEIVRILQSLEQQGATGGAAPGRIGPASEKPIMIADERTNSILLGGGRSGRLRLLAIISHLDTPLETGGNTHVVYLRYAKAKELAPVLSGLGETIEKDKKGGAAAAAPAAKAGAAKTSLNIQADESTNALVITAPPDTFKSLQAVIRQLDVRRAQVMVEAVIAEVTSDKLAELGIQWAVDATPSGNGPAGVTNFGGADRSIVQIGGAIAQNTAPVVGTGLSLAIGRFSKNSSSTNFAALLNALAQDAGTNVLATPNLMTLDNQEAEIVVAQNVPFVTGSFTTTADTSSNPFQTIQRQDVGLKLKITPQINEGDAVKLDIEAEQSRLDPTAQSTSGAVDLVTTKRSIKTSVLVNDGGMVVLGGLIQDDMRDTEQRVPGLGDLPLIGALFRYRSSTAVKTNLMAFLRPLIVRDADQANFIAGNKYNYIRSRQLEEREREVGVLPKSASPLLPPVEEFLELPPPFEEQARPPTEAPGGVELPPPFEGAAPEQ